MELCPYCPATYSSNGQLITHMKEKHPTLFLQNTERAAITSIKTRAFAEKITIAPKKIVIPAEYVGVVVARD